MSRSAAVILVALTVAAPLSAQRIEHTQVAAHQARHVLADDARPGAFAANTLTNDLGREAREPGRPSIPAMVVAGTVLGAVGLFAGGALGIAAEDCNHHPSEFCGLGGAILGGLIGESIGVPVGVHLVGRKGSLGGEIGTSFGVSFLGVLSAFASQGIGILFVPPVQLMTSIAFERNAKK